MQTFQLAYRNLQRNTRRTILTAMLIGFSLTALILVDALIDGMIEVMTNQVTDTLVGEAQIHKKGFREEQDVDLYLSNLPLLEQALDSDPDIAAFAPRVISGGMISSSYNVTAGLYYGVDAEREADVSKVKESVVKGSYLTGAPGEILMGYSMAELLEVDLGDRIVLTLSEVDTGELTQALFRITGLLDFGMREMDEGLVFINLAKGQEVLGMAPGDIHEVAIKFIDKAMASDPTRGIYHTFDPDTEVVSWLTANPEIASILDMSSYSSLIIGIVLFILATLGVINSMFMSIYERIYEFGVIRAIGTRPMSLASLILAEALLLAFLSCIIGVVLAYLLGSWAEVHGVPMGEMEVSGLSVDSNTIKTKLSLQQFVIYPIYVTALTLVAAIYPARFAAKLIPTEALQRSL